MSLRRVLFVGGSPCAGKSTLAERIARRFGLQYFRCDDRWNDHAQAANPEQHPTMVRLGSMPLPAILSRAVEVMFRDEIEAYREEWSFMLAELALIPDPEPVIAEGAALMPELVASLMPRARAAYLVPTNEFQREHYARRDWAWNLCKQTPDPAGTFDGWMQRDARFAAYMHETAIQHGFPVMVVDGSRTLEGTQGWLEDALGLG